jgi:RNA polymerase sigma-70 factor (ECF subfamily)
MDADLVLAAQSGSEAAFGRIVTVFGGRLQAVAYRVLRDRELAEDATQAGLLRIWQNLPKLRDPARFEAWAYQLLVRACYAEARRSRPRSVARLIDTDLPAHDRLLDIVDRDQLERAFARLSVEHRAVVVLHHFAGLPLAEVAALLEIPTGTAASRLHYAMRGLHAALDAADRLVLQEATR